MTMTENFPAAAPLSPWAKQKSWNCCSLAVPPPMVQAFSTTDFTEGRDSKAAVSSACSTFHQPRPHLQFFDAANNLIFSHAALAAGNEGLSFLGGVAGPGEDISRVRITSGTSWLTSNGLLNSPRGVSRR